jgi:hypothetical protein
MCSSTCKPSLLECSSHELQTGTGGSPRLLPRTRTLSGDIPIASVICEASITSDLNAM